MTQSKDRLAQLRITEFSKDGQGIGIAQQQEGPSLKVEVPFSSPGDEVLVLLKKKKGVYQSLPLEWIQLSEQRVAPLCRHFGQCGGCRWQHVSYADQLKQKEVWIHRYLEPFLHSEVSWHPIIPCLPPWQYRNKMELTFSSDKAGNRYLGLILYGTRGHVFQMQECHLTHPWIIDAVQAVSKWWADSGLEAYRSGRDAGSLRTLTLREGQRTGDRLVMLTVSGNPQYALRQMDLRNFVSILREKLEPADSDQKLSIFLRIQQIAKGVPTQFYEMVLYGPDHIREILRLEMDNRDPQTLQFRISPTAFFQPNTRQAEKLYSRAIHLTNVSKDATVFDLYCGAGTLGICLSKWVKEVIGIEISPESVIDARENIKLNHLTNVSIHQGDVGRVLPTILPDQKPPDIVMVDPPVLGLTTN